MTPKKTPVSILREALESCRAKEVPGEYYPETEYRFDEEKVKAAVAALDDFAATASGVQVEPEQPKLTLALPDYEKRRIVIASDELIDDERLVCIAIEDPPPQQAAMPPAVQSVSRAEYHNTAWKLYHDKALDDPMLRHLSIHVLRNVFDSCYEALAAAPTLQEKPSFIDFAGDPSPEQQRRVEQKVQEVLHELDQRPETIYRCSNPACGFEHASDPCGHCPKCIKPTGEGWSTYPDRPRASSPSAAPASNSPGFEGITTPSVSELPTLPEPEHTYFDGGEIHPTGGFTEDQMREYAIAARSMPANSVSELQIRAYDHWNEDRTSELVYAEWFNRHPCEEHKRGKALVYLDDVRALLSRAIPTTAAGVGEWISDPDRIPQPIINACRGGIYLEFGITGAHGYCKRILAKVFRAMLAASPLPNGGEDAK